jgi:stress response protein YsnF
MKPEERREEQVIPLREEAIQVHKEVVTTGTVAIDVRTIIQPTEVDMSTTSKQVGVDIVSINQYVDTAPATRTEGDTIIIPVVEEVMVKRFYVKEEVRVRIVHTTSLHREVVDLRKQVVDFTRKDEENAN